MKSNRLIHLVLTTLRLVSAMPASTGVSEQSISQQPASNNTNTSLGDPFQPSVYRAGDLIVLIDNYETHLGKKWSPSVYRELSARILHDLEAIKSLNEARDTDPLPTPKWEVRIAASEIHFEVNSPNNKGVLYKHIADLAEALRQFSYDWRRTQNVPALTIFLSDIRYPGTSLGIAKINWYDTSATAGGVTSNAQNQTDNFVEVAKI